MSDPHEEDSMSEDDEASDTNNERLAIKTFESERNPLYGQKG